MVVFWVEPKGGKYYKAGSFFQCLDYRLVVSNQEAYNSQKRARWKVGVPVGGLCVDSLQSCLGTPALSAGKGRTSLDACRLPTTVVIIVGVNLFEFGRWSWVISR
jgi:hypothetical protein